MGPFQQKCVHSQFLLTKCVLKTHTCIFQKNATITPIDQGFFGKGLDFLGDHTDEFKYRF